MRKLLPILFLLIANHSFSQHKTDVLVFGASASGASAAIQAARSGVKVILLNEGATVVGNALPKMDVPAFELGFWKEWQDSCKKDSVIKDPRAILEQKFLKKVKGLQYLSSIKVLKVRENGKSWSVEIERNGKKEEIKCKALVDAGFGDEAILKRFNLVSFVGEKIKSIINYSESQKQQPYNEYTKFYRTSIAAGYGVSKDSTYYFPLGSFVSKDKPSIMVANISANMKGLEHLQNIALWTNIGQSVGALAAYGPFFNTTSDKANVRMIQGEVFTYKSFIYPVVDIPENDFAFFPVQRIIGSQILRHDFVTGKFNPEGLVNKNDIKDILSELHPRSRIWFIENPSVSDLTLKETISLISFIGGKESYSIEDELKRSWKDKFKLNSDYSLDKFITKKEYAILMDLYLAPFSVRVNMEGLFIK
ncbi:hypothetical protein Pedsa_2913 [Pseudopedobacter saltans DSM 12145]|uniref:FAD-dependent oxidoreductase n=1 Tax=Pseudopedobacter saltans (strain ATCC 51119 / DSM 12145 / JCM 21818 / CCUG 39354 / LMG 10337 / NBRC 100064 / NCIMB 13643) TaxID=762903 RepID=F0S8W5_PSESL|nr:FAD-dependent oxidoreductase [Pseudopedobacter saltans]ADY53452.1 hypothetical protein Pedsa_2913 [Pseudopedobacter saltans DSM 12145]